MAPAAAGNDGSVRGMLASLKTKARNAPALLRSRTSSATSNAASDASGWSEVEERRGLVTEEDSSATSSSVPALPTPEISRPFPVVEQPSRVVFSSLDSPHFERTYLTSTRNGTVTVSGSRGDREQFLLVPVDDDADNDAGDDGYSDRSETDVAADSTKRAERKDLFYLRSYKFNRYLTSGSTSGSVSTVDFSKKKGDDDGDDGEGRKPINKPGESERWRLVRSPHGGHFVVSDRNESNIACRRGGPAIEIGLAGNADRAESWEVEFVSGELCFLSSSSSSSSSSQLSLAGEKPIRQQVRCDLMGALALTDDRRGWEVWRFVETGGGRLRIVSWMHPFCVACAPDGRATTVAVGGARADDRGGADEWTAERAPEGYDGVVLRSAAGERRVLARDEGGGGGLTTTRELEGEGGVWRLDAAHSQTYTMTPARDERRSVGPFPYVTENLKQSDQIVLQRTDDEGTVRMYHKSRGQYLRSGEGGELRCDSTPPDDADPSDLWEMEQRPASEGGGYAFSSKIHGQFLAVTTDVVNPKLCTVPSFDRDRASWIANPILPRAVSSAKIKTFALGASVAVGTTVAMPFLMAGMLAVVPAEATLMASILSVGLTSAEAIASVGAIGATAAIVFREESDTLGMESEHKEGGDDGGEDVKDYKKRPLCSWRSW